MKQKFTSSFFISENAIIGYLFIFKILFHLLHPEYGYFRDEFFYIAISDQFSFGNLDVLPLTPLFLKLFTTILGYSIKSLHFASSLCGAFSLLLACLITRELGGKKYKSTENNPSIPLFTERQINALGYEYLFNGQVKEAIVLFRFNVEVYPASSNVYDSLGEGYMENGQYELSILNYKISLELNPNNSNAKEKLKELSILKEFR